MYLHQLRQEQTTRFSRSHIFNEGQTGETAVADFCRLCSDIFGVEHTQGREGS